MNSLSFQLLNENPLINFLGFFLVHSLWQATIIAAAAAILLLSLRRASANLRYLVAGTALVAMIGVPLFTSAYYSGIGNSPVAELPACEPPLLAIDSTPGQHSLATPSNSSSGRSVDGLGRRR